MGTGPWNIHLDGGPQDGTVIKAGGILESFRVTVQGRDGWFDVYEKQSVEAVIYRVRMRYTGRFYHGE